MPRLRVTATWGAALVVLGALVTGVLAINGGRFTAQSNGSMPPEAMADSYLVSGTSITVTAPGFLSNDHDPNGQPFSPVLVNGPQYGTLDFQPSGGFTFNGTPQFVTFGTDRFTYKLVKGALESDAVPVNLHTGSSASSSSAGAGSSSAPASGPIYGCVTKGSQCITCQTVAECQAKGANPISSNLDNCSNVACGYVSGGGASSQSGGGSSASAGASSSVPPSLCGNNVANPGEQCRDGGLVCSGAQTCNFYTCLCSGGLTCGNGVIDPGEECRDGGLSCPAGSTCTTSSCVCAPSPLCGNGTVNAGEACNEPGLSCGAGQVCNTSSCACSQKPPVCGNGIAESGEKCGEPGLFCASGQTCNMNTCGCSGGTSSAASSVSSAAPGCGNDVLEGAEQCDDGNTKDNDCCSGICRTEPGCMCFEGPVAASSSSSIPVSTASSAPSPGGGAGSSAGNLCGNGTVNSGEQCGEPGRSCSAGFTCNTTTCTCTQSQPVAGNCADSDGGINLAVKGSATNGASTVTDWCDDLGFLHDGICMWSLGMSFPGQAGVGCYEGQRCQDGRCVNIDPLVSCSAPDSGNIYKAGTLTFMGQDNVMHQRPDWCLTSIPPTNEQQTSDSASNGIMKFECLTLPGGGFQINQRMMRCPSGRCANGACQQ